MQSAPDWLKKAIRPAAGILRANEAFSWTLGSVLITPKQFGPIMAMPYSAQMSLRRRSRSTPLGPTSRNPAEMTIAERIPFFPHCSKARSTTLAGKTITAWSTSSSISSTYRYARTAQMLRLPGATG